MSKVTKKTRYFGNSLPIDLVNRIDLDRKDIPRTKFIQRVLENFYKNKDINTGTIGIINRIYNVDDSHDVRQGDDHHVNQRAYPKNLSGDK